MAITDNVLQLHCATLALTYKNLISTVLEPPGYLFQDLVNKSLILMFEFGQCNHYRTKIIGRCPLYHMVDSIREILRDT